MIGQWSVGIILSVALLVSGLSAAEAGHIVCGDLLGPEGEFALDSNVGPCSGPEPALTVDSAKLDLAGFTVSCSDFTVHGIHLVGERAQVGNGTVSGCGNGILVAGDGKHRVNGVTTSSDVDTGIVVESDKNRLTGNDIAGDVGIVIIGHQNTLKKSTVTTGFSNDAVVIEGNRNKVIKNLVTDTDATGVQITGPSK